MLPHAEQQRCCYCCCAVLLLVLLVVLLVVVVVLFGVEGAAHRGHARPAGSRPSREHGTGGPSAAGGRQASPPCGVHTRNEKKKRKKKTEAEDEVTEAEDKKWDTRP